MQKRLKKHSESDENKSDAHAGGEANFDEKRATGRVVEQLGGSAVGGVLQRVHLEPLHGQRHFWGVTVARERGLQP